MRPPERARPVVRLIALLLLLAISACAGSTPPKVKSQQRGMPEDIGGVPVEKPFKEIEGELPAYPQDSALLQFQPRRNSQNSFYIDRDAVSIGADRVIRYSVVVRSPSGALNVDYEGMRCKTAEYKVYAYGITPGEWTLQRDPQWRSIPRSSADFRFALYKDYFCDLEAIAGRDAKDLIGNLAGYPLNNVTDKNR